LSRSTLSFGERGAGGAGAPDAASVELIAIAVKPVAADAAAVIVDAAVDAVDGYIVLPSDTAGVRVAAGAFA